MLEHNPVTAVQRDRRDQFAGAMLGTAVGDALGLPREGLSRRRPRRLFGRPPLRHRFLLGRGMVSDDTEHACMVGQALLRAPHDADAFARSLAWRLRGGCSACRRARAGPPRLTNGASPVWLTGID